MKYLLAIFFFLGICNTGFAEEIPRIDFHNQDRIYIQKKILCIENSIYELEAILVDIEWYKTRPEKVKEKLRDAFVHIDNMKAALK